MTNDLHDEAAEVAASGIEKFPDHAELNFTRAVTFENLDQFDKMVIHLQRAITADPEHADAMNYLGYSYAERGINLNKALEMEPWNVEPNAALGLLFYSEKLYKRAETYFRKALSIEPDHALSKKHMAELVGPEKSFKDSIMKGIKKTFPSVFKKKK